MGISEIFPDTRKEMALSLAGYTVAGLTSLVFLDYGTVAIGLKSTASLPSEISTFAVMAGTTLLGYIIGKKSS